MRRNILDWPTILSICLFTVDVKHAMRHEFTLTAERSNQSFPALKIGITVAIRRLHRLLWDDPGR